MSAASSRLSGALVATLVAASFISLMSFGVRAAFGLFTAPLPPDLGITREAYSLAIAVQNLCWGVTQPFAGHLTDRFGARRVMLVGALLYLAGILGLVVSGTALHVLLSAGVLVVDTAYELLSQAVHGTVGVYRTSFLSSEDFGIGRHPAHGSFTVQGFSFAYEIVDVG